MDVDEIFAICSIGRAATDEGVQAVFELAARANLSNVGIICTRSDVSFVIIPVSRVLLVWRVETKLSPGHSTGRGCQNMGWRRPSKDPGQDG